MNFLLIKYLRNENNIKLDFQRYKFNSYIWEKYRLKLKLIYFDNKLFILLYRVLLALKVNINLIFFFIENINLIELTHLSPNVRNQKVALSWIKKCVKWTLTLDLPTLVFRPKMGKINNYASLSLASLSNFLFIHGLTFCNFIFLFYKCFLMSNLICSIVIY